MPKIVTPLTLRQVKSACPKDKIYKLADGGGLSLWVLPSDGKSWRMTYIRPSDKKTDTLVSGLYPEFSLADARQWRDEIRAKLARGIDPKAGIVDLGAKYRLENRLAEWYERWKLDGGNRSLPAKMEERGVLEYLKRVKSSLGLIFDYLVADVWKQ